VIKMTRKGRFSMMMLLLVVSIIFHEITHGTMFRYFGCKSVRYGIWLTGPYTKCTDDEFVCSEQCILAHSINEIVGYNIIPQMLFIQMILLKRAKKVKKVR